MIRHEQGPVGSRLHMAASPEDMTLPDELALPDEPVTRERHRIAMELHDGLVQTLFGTGLSLRAAAHRCTGEPRRVLFDAALRIGRLVDEVRAEILVLEGGELVVPELGAGLDLLAEAAAACGLDVQVEVERETPISVEPEVRRACLQVARESIANAVRHADASRIDVRLSIDPEVLRLNVRDDGRGFTPPSTGTGHGLRNMGRRAEELGGQLEVRSSPGGGTSVELTVRRSMTGAIP